VVQQPVHHVGTNDGQLNNLMGVIRGQCHNLPMATGTSLGTERYGGSRVQQDLWMAGMTMCASRLPSLGGWPPSLALGRRRIC
jgi:hypothetical protein